MLPISPIWKTKGVGGPIALLRKTKEEGEVGREGLISRSLLFSQLPLDVSPAFASEFILTVSGKALQYTVGTLGRAKDGDGLSRRQLSQAKEGRER